MKQKSLRNYLALLLIAVVITAAAVLLNRIQRTEMVSRTGSTFEKGVVEEILRDNLNEDGTRAGDQRITVRMTTGVRKGQTVEATSSSGYLFGTACKPGLKVVVLQSVSGETTISSVYSQDRGGILILFAVLYLVTLVLVGGKQGLRGALGLLFTFVVIIFIWIPLIYLGFSPILTAVIICAVTTALTFWCIAGISRKSVSATLGTVSGIITAGIVAVIFSRLTGITGWNVSNIETLLTIYQTNGIQVGELLFAGILISALGAEMDVAMSVSSSMQEICHQNPAISRTELFKAGMRIGRDMMGTDSNTLILAFAGTEVSTLVLNFAYDLPALQILNSNNIGIAVMEGLAGSFGVVLSVPLTVLIASFLVREAGAQAAAGITPHSEA